MHGQDGRLAHVAAVVGALRARQAVRLGVLGAQLA